MATVIDTLIVALGIDASKFSAGVSKAAKDEERLTGSTAKLSKETDKASKAASNHGKQLAQMAGQGVKAFNDMKTAAVQMFASYLTATGIEKLIVNLTAADAKLGRMSQNLGIASAEIKAWSNVAEQSGGSAAGMQNDITSLTKSMIDFKQTGNFSPMLSGIASIGVGIQDAQGHAKSATQIMLDLSDRVKGMSRPDASAFLSNHVGLDEGTINTILQGREALEKQLAAQKENAAAAAANTKKSEELEKATAALKQKFEAVGNELVGRLTPYLIQLAEWMERNSGTVTVLATTIGGLLVALASMSIVTTIVGVIASFVSVIKKVSMVTKLWTALQWLLNAALTANPIGAVIMAIALLAAGVYYAYTHFDSFKNGVDGAWDKLKNFADGIKNDIKPVFDWLGDVMGKVMSGDFKGALVMIGKGVVDVATSAVNAVVNSDAGRAVKQAATNAHAGYREGSTGEKTEGANEAGAPYQAGKSLGSLSAKYEGKVGSANRDNIGYAYGKYQFNESTGGLQAFMRAAPEYAAKFRGLTAGTSAFAEKWKEIAKSDPKGFEAAQDKAAAAKWYAPAAKHAEKAGFKMENRGVQEAVFSGSINHGGINRILSMAAGAQGFSKMTAAEQIKAFYSARSRYVEANVSNKDPHREKTIAGLKSRYANEQRDALKLSGQPAQQTQLLPTGVQASRPVAMAASQTRNSTSTSEVHIQNQVINTQATDAKGIARDITPQLKNQMLVSQANTGMSS